jgi:hypothetical protein
MCVDAKVKDVFDKKFSGWNETDDFAKIGTCSCGADLYCGIYSWEDIGSNLFCSKSFHFCLDSECSLISENYQKTCDDEPEGLEFVDDCCLCHRDGRKKAAKKAKEAKAVWLTEDEAIERKIGEGKSCDKDVTWASLSEKCSCGAPKLCVVESYDTSSMYHVNSWHICLSKDCQEKDEHHAQTCNMGGGPGMGDDNFFQCWFCDRKV